MGIVNGSCSFRRFFCSAKNIDPFDMEVDRAASRFAAPDIESMSDEKSLGWVTILHLLDRDLRVEKNADGRLALPCNAKRSQVCARNACQGFYAT